MESGCTAKVFILKENLRMLNFCTLFNSGYLSRGLALYQSLERNCDDFHLYVFAFDDVCFQFLSDAEFKHLTVISLREFEDERLLSIKSTRSQGEYCWTCTASTIRYAITKFNLDQCTYLDADLYFYSNPKVLLDELGSNSVMITEHRYTAAYDQSLESGRYCVQFMTFNNDEKGMKVLERWRNDCIDWCYARIEDGKFGDQKYLDTWTQEFEGVHEMEHLGGGVAPWNMQQFEFLENDSKKQVKELSTGRIFDLIFFHFHGLKFFENDIVSYTGDRYEMDTQERQLLFEPYTKELLNIGHWLGGKLPGINFHAIAGISPQKPINILSLLRWYFYDVRMSFRNINGQKTRDRLKHHHYYKLIWHE
jgi:hypothetical protein